MADANVLATSVTISGVTVAVIQWAKRSKYFPWLTKERVIIMRGLSALSATAAGFGVTYTWNPVDHGLTIIGLTLPAIAGIFWSVAKQFTMNELVWQVTKPSSNPAVVEAVAPQAAIEQGIVPEKH